MILGDDTSECYNAKQSSYQDQIKGVSYDTRQHFFFC